MIRNIKFEKLYNYNPNVDYTKVVVEYNKMVARYHAETNCSVKLEIKAKVRALLREHGGVIALTGKMCYQREINAIGI